MLMDSADAYESCAHDFLSARDQSPIGSSVVDRWARSLSEGATVIELGCGGGYPITQTLSAAGLKIWAVDSSPTLIKKFQSRFPDVRVECAKVQESRFFDRTYHGAIAIGLVFLLPESDQAALLSSVANALQPEGRFLFTAPIERGDWIDMNTGLVCKSLGETVYEEHLRIAGFRIVATFTDAGDNNYYDVQLIA